MKDWQSTMRRIDEEITGWRQQIATAQVQVARLEDTRRVIMGLADADAQAQQDPAGRRESPGLLNGAHAAPVLIVRKTGSGDDAPKKRASKGRGKTTIAARPGYRHEIAELLRKEGRPMFSAEIGAALGEPSSSQRNYQTLHWMKRSGDIEKAENGAYQLVGAAKVEGFRPPEINGAYLGAEVLEKRIRMALTTAPKRPTDIIANAHGAHVGDRMLKDRYYSLLKRMVKHGEVVNNDGLYSLPH